MARPVSVTRCVGVLSQGTNAEIAIAEIVIAIAAMATGETGSGSCRDFALLLMEVARGLGMAARFVTGYLYDPAVDGGDQVNGAGATHAWTQIYLPGPGWVEIDPTNGLMGGRNLIRVAVARDPTQAVPISGSFDGSMGQALGLDVEVTVALKRDTMQAPAA